jgi:hypothetical protein
MTTLSKARQNALYADSVINVKDYGAVGDGVANDTAALQAAHNTGLLVYYPAGTYKFTNITISAGGIVGDGTTTILNCTDTSTTAGIKFTGVYTILSGGLTSGTPLFRNFTLNGNSLKTTGAGLQFDPPSGETSYAHLENVTITYFPICVDFVNASLWKMVGCVIGGHYVAGVKVDNVRDNDAGDSVITGCVFNSASTTAPHILHLSSGGLKIVGNKLLGGGYGYFMQYTGTANTSNLLIQANSIENFTSNAIALTKVSAGLTAFKNVVIDGNEIAVALATPSAFLIVIADTFVQSMTVTGNVIQLPGTTNSYGFVATGVTCLNITGNTFRGNGGTSQAIGLTSCVDAKIGTNVYSNITTTYSLATPGANNSVVLDSQSGSSTTSASGWSAYYGTLYISGTETVTFAQPFATTPQLTDCTFTPAAGDGIVSAIAIGVTKTQLQYVAIASRTPGFAGTVYWKVSGVL